MQKTISTIKSLILVLALTIGMSYVFAAWTGPTGTPPNNNADAPINVSEFAQYKNAGLSLNGDLLSLADICVIHMDGNTVVKDKCLKNLAGGTRGGVSKILAGTGITVTPTTGTGDVTVSATNTSNSSDFEGFPGYITCSFTDDSGFRNASVRLYVIDKSLFNGGYQGAGSTVMVRYGGKIFSVVGSGGTARGNFSEVHALYPVATRTGGSWGSAVEVGVSLLCPTNI